MAAAWGQAAVIATVGEYYGATLRFSGMRDLDVWCAKLDVETLTRALRSAGKKGKRLEKAAEMARTKDSMEALPRLTQRMNGSLRIISDLLLSLPPAKRASRP